MTRKLALILTLCFTMGMGLAYAGEGSCGGTCTMGPMDSSKPVKKAKSAKKAVKSGKTVSAPAITAAPSATK